MKYVHHLNACPPETVQFLSIAMGGGVTHSPAIRDA